MAAEAACIPCTLFSPHVSLLPLPGVPLAVSGMMPPANIEEHANARAAHERLSSGLNGWLPVLNHTPASLRLDPLGHVCDHYDRVDRPLVAMNPAFDFPAERLPGNVRYIGPLLDPPARSRPWKAPWSGQPRRPRVLVSFRTNLQGKIAMPQRIISSLGDLTLMRSSPPAPQWRKRHSSHHPT